MNSTNYRSTDFVLSPSDAPPSTQVLFVKTGNGTLSLAGMEDIQRLIIKSYEEGLRDGHANHEINTKAIDEYRRGYNTGFQKGKRLRLRSQASKGDK